MSIRSDRIRSAVQIVGVLGVGICVGAALTATPPARAQTGDAALAAQVADLADRVTKLEKGEFTAPFVVKDGSGQPVFRVDSNGSETALMVGSSSGLATLSAGEEVELSLAKGNGAVVLTSSAEGSGLAVKGSSGDVFVEEKGGAPMIRITGSGGDVFNVNSDGGNPTLTVKNGSKSIVLAASASDTGVEVDDGDSTFLMGDYPGLQGFIAAKGQQPVAALAAKGDDKYRVGVYDAGQPVFIGGHNGSHVGLFVHDLSGNEIANIDSAVGSAGGRLKLLGPGGKDIASLGTPEGGGDGGALSLTQGGNKVTLGYGTGAGASLVFSEGGEEAFSVKKNGDGGVLTLGKSDRSVIVKAAGSEAIVIAKQGARQTEMGVTQKSTGFVVGDTLKPLAGLVDNGDNKPFLGIYGGGSNALLSAGFQPDGKLALRVGESSKPVARLGQGEGGAGSLDIFGASGGKPVISLDNPGGSNPQLRVMSSGGETVVLVGAKSDGSGGAVRVLAKGQLAGGIDAMPDGSGNAYAVAGGKVIAEMRGEGGKGLVAIYGDGGAAVAHMGAGSSGGGNFTATDPGGQGVFSAGYTPDGPGTACVEHNGTKCLGIGLTGMEGFH